MGVLPPPGGHRLLLPVPLPTKLGKRSRRLPGVSPFAGVQALLHQRPGEDTPPRPHVGSQRRLGPGRGVKGVAVRLQHFHGFTRALAG